LNQENERSQSGVEASGALPSEIQLVNAPGIPALEAPFKKSIEVSFIGTIVSGDAFARRFNDLTTEDDPHQDSMIYHALVSNTISPFAQAKFRIAASHRGSILRHRNPQSDRLRALAFGANSIRSIDEIDSLGGGQ
jgi:hypothetical protein